MRGLKTGYCALFRRIFDEWRFQSHKSTNCQRRIRKRSSSSRSMMMVHIFTGRTSICTLAGNSYFRLLIRKPLVKLSKRVTNSTSVMEPRFVGSEKKKASRLLKRQASAINNFDESREGSAGYITTQQRNET